MTEPDFTFIPALDLADLEPVDVVEPTGNISESYVQTVPEFVWSVGHSLRRTPVNVAVLQDGDPVEVTVTAGQFSIVAVFVEPKTGRIEFE